MAAAYDLRAAIAEVLDRTSETDPRVIAGEVAHGVPSNVLRQVLAEALETVVRHEIQKHRRNNPIVGPPELHYDGSPKVRAIRAHWNAAMRDLIHVGGAWKHLGDCDYEDLMYAAEERRDLARQNAEAADRYERLAKLVQSHGVKRVADLPPTAIDELEIAS